MQVLPETKTTLLCNKYYQAFNFCTARAAFKHLITNRARGVDASGNAASWDGRDIIKDNSDTVNTLSWKDKTVTLFDDQPYLRSAPSPITGEETRWAIPTILICTYHFGYNVRKGENVSLKTLYGVYKGQCQYCLEKIPIGEATKDHVFPRDQHGSNHDFNLVLACRSCNNKKDNTYPYYNIEGKEVKAKTITNLGLVVPDVKIRKEWLPYLFLN